MGSEDRVEMEAEDLVLHVVIITVPCPGHLIPASQMAKHLLSLGMKVSCFNTGINYPSVERHFEEKFGEVKIVFRPLRKENEFVPPGKRLEEHLDWIQHLNDEAMAERLAEALRNLTPPPACIISDMLVGWSQDVANAFHIPRFLLYTMPANALLYMITSSTSLVSPAVAPKRPPDIWKSMVDPTSSINDYLHRNARRFCEAAMILVNTVEDLEAGLLDLMRTELIGKPNVKLEKLLPIGPLIRSYGGEICSDNSVSHNQEDTSCAEIFRWLDTQEDSSVLYVSFGTLVTVNESQAHELAHGLEQSGTPFLWVYRPPEVCQVLPMDASVQDSLLDGLPTGFMERIEGRGRLITQWAPQQLILSHRSVGGFMSHCGWNSTLEALWAGKPIVAWPCAIDQELTARYLVDDIKLAVEVHKNDDGLVESAEVARAISLLMDENTGSGIRSWFVKMQQLAHKAIGEGGSSKTNLKTLVDRLKSHLKTLP
ncbi:UDP-glycosyltransferase 72B1 [Physcomitrium patens]|uniref:Glycosyltransferase n=1 Tax=Physcomitrium patens TaxID=3218 RepID=A0A2K1JYI7_PHYPA|nr:UDP-glycosyltransferase 72B1-like [Physcomitrium patens]PNR46589.1 hypothetical protein PHYPA_013708 [Physcomitrium patens]|eukprot:XP_024386159.1 UDP-glycosyltransferase 72B1-like [Physcomitrella patens]